GPGGRLAAGRRAGGSCHPRPVRSWTPRCRPRRSGARPPCPGGSGWAARAPRTGAGAPGAAAAATGRAGAAGRAPTPADHGTRETIGGRRRRGAAAAAPSGSREAAAESTIRGEGRPRVAESSLEQAPLQPAEQEVLDRRVGGYAHIAQLVRPAEPLDARDEAPELALVASQHLGVDRHLAHFP